MHSYSFFFFNDTATTEIYTLSLHDALPIWMAAYALTRAGVNVTVLEAGRPWDNTTDSAMLTWPYESPRRSEEHTSELQSLAYLVCRLLLEKKNKDSGIIFSGRKHTLSQHYL